MIVSVGSMLLDTVCQEQSKSVVSSHYCSNYVLITVVKSALS